MKKIKKMLALAGCVAALGLSSGKLAAQGRGNYDPTQYINNIVDQMNVTDDAEKKTITEAITKVFDARRDIGFGGMRFGGRRNRSGNTDANSSSTDTASQNTRRRGGGSGTPSPEMEDLQKAVDAKDTAEIKAKLAKLRESNQAKQAKLEAAQADLQKLLTSRQEAIAVLNGVLK